MRLLTTYALALTLAMTPHRSIVFAQTDHPTCSRIRVHLDEMGRQFAQFGQQAAPQVLKLCESAVGGNTEDQLMLARLFVGGWFAPRDVAEAYKLNLAAAEAGNLTAQAIIGHGLLHAYERKDRDAKRGLQMIKDAADKKNPLGLFNYGWALSRGLTHLTPEELSEIGFNKDTELGDKLIEEAANLGNGNAAVAMSLKTSRNGINSESFEWVRKGAMAGSASSMRELATHYSTGQIVEKDSEKHVYYMMQAAIMGSMSARDSLALYHIRGTYDLPVDYDLAEFWYRKALDLGSTEAEHELARRSEWGVERKEPWKPEEAIAIGLFSFFAFGVAVEIMGGGSSQPSHDVIDMEQWRYEQAIKAVCQPGLSYELSVFAGCP